MYSFLTELYELSDNDIHIYVNEPNVYPFATHLHIEYNLEPYILACNSLAARLVVAILIQLTHEFILCFCVILVE